MTVIAEIGSVEDDCAVEGRRDTVHASLSRPIPELQVASPIVRPVLVEVDEKVQSSEKVQPLVEVEVGMDAKRSAAPNLVQPAASQVRIGNEAGDSRQLFQERHEGRGIQLTQHRPRGRAEALEVLRRILPLCRALGVVPRRAIHRIEFGNDLPEKGWVQQFLNDQRGGKGQLNDRRPYGRAECLSAFHAR